MLIIIYPSKKVMAKHKTTGSKGEREMKKSKAAKLGISLAMAFS